METLTCLLCNNYFDRKPLLDLITGDLSESDGRSLKEFEDGLGLFLKLLNSDKQVENLIGSEVKSEGLIEDHPVCESCWVALEDLIKLQRIIRDAEARQEEVVGVLKEVIGSGKNANSIIASKWLPVRSHLLQAVCGSIADFSTKEDGNDLIENREGYQRLESHPEDFSDDYGPPAKKKRSVAKTKSASSRRGNKAKVEEVTKILIKKKWSPPGSVPGTRRPQYQLKDLFHSITENLYLCKSTLIQIYPTHFTCLQSNCNFKADGSDYFTFQRMKEHILAKHINTNDSKADEVCPLCQASLKPGDEFREHIRKLHTPFKGRYSQEVICESCRKPVTYRCYPVHIWEHKSEEEKQFQVSSGEPLHYDIRVKLGLIGKEKPNTSKEKLSTEDSKEVKRSRKFLHFANFKQSPRSKNVFILDNCRLYYRDITIQCSPSGLVCAAPNCSKQIDGIDFQAFQEMKTHIRDNHSNLCLKGLKTCPVCNLKFNGVLYIRHIFDVHDPPTVCESCLKPMRNPGTIIRHTYSHMNDEEKAVFDSEGKYKNYVKPKKEVFKCPECEKQFFTRKDFKAHEKTHLENHLRQQFICSECGAQFISRNGLRQHTEKKHRPSDDPLKVKTCPICGKKFYWRNLTRYKNHLRSHSGDKPWVCEKCGRGFGSQKGYSKHLKFVHAEGRPFQCEFCEKSFKQKEVLNSHLKNVHKSRE